MQFSRTNLANAVVIALIVGILSACSIYAPRYPEITFVVASMTGAFATVLRLPISQFIVPPAPSDPPPVPPLIVASEETIPKE